MTQKIIVWTVMLICLALPALAVTSFNDTFTRADANDVGNGWAETNTQSNNYTISSNELLSEFTGGGTHVVNRTFSTSTADYFTFTLNASNVDGQIHIELRDGTAQTIHLRYTGNEASDEIRFFEATYQATGCTYLANVEHKMELANISYTNFTFRTYQDGTECTSNTPHGFQTDDSTVDQVRFGDHAIAGDYKIDDVCFGNTGDCDAIFNPPVAPAPVLNLSLTSPTPDNNTQFNTLELNFTVTGNDTTTYNISLLIDGVVNQTLTDVGTGVSLINFTVNFTASGTHTYSFNATDSAGSNITTTNTFFVDLTIPTITTNFLNNTVFFRFENLVGDFNFTDEFQLSSYNISIDGVQRDGNDTLESTTKNVTFTFNISTLSPGNHNLSVRVADGHTANKIPFYTVSDGFFNDYIRFNTPYGTQVKIYADTKSIFDTWTADKQEDRYTFTYEPSRTFKTTTFIVETNMPMRVTKGNAYGGQWIIVGNHWLDFVQETDPSLPVSIVLESAYKARVTVQTKNADTLSFSSIGDLNVVTQNFTFFTVNATATFTSPVLELASATHTLFVEAGQTMDDISAALTYNNTLQNVTKTNTSQNATFTTTVITPRVNESVNLTVFWDINFTLTNGTTFFGNLTAQQEVLPFGVDNCTTFTTRALNFTIRNETNEAVVPNGTLAGNFQVKIQQLSEALGFNLSWAQKDDSNYAVCMDPNGESFLFDADMEYSATGFQTKTHYFDNSTLDNITNFINLFLTDTTSLVEFTVVDENNKAVEAAFINIQRCDITTASCATSEIIKTDSDGNAIGSIILNTVFYRFTLTKDNSLLLQTTELKLTSTQKTFRVTLGTDVIDNFNQILSTVCDITFDNTTNDFNFVFTDTSGNVNEACLRVVRRTMNGDSVVNETCVSSSSGSIFSNTGNVSGSTASFIGIGTLRINGDEFICGDSVTNTFDRTFEIFGTAGGLFMAFFLIIALSTTFIFNPTYAILGTALAMAVLSALQLWYITWGILVGWFIIAGIVIWRINRGT